jgi:trigger factor
MQVSLESAKGLERRLRVQVPAERIEQEIAARLMSVGRKAKIQGFRPGKIPAKVIRQRFGGQVRQEVLQEVVQSSYSEAIVQQKLQPAGGPRIEPDNMEEGQDLTYTAIFEVMPEITLNSLNKIKIDSPEVTISDADVDAMVENLRKQRADWKAVDRKAAAGDQLTIDFDGTLNGEAFAGGSAKGFKFVLGDGGMLEEFEKNLLGVAPGAQITFKMKFPKDYHSPELAGEKVEFKVVVNEVAEQLLPEINADFIKAYGIESGAAEDLRQDIRKNMDRELVAKRKAYTRAQLLDGLLSTNPIDLPEVLVRQECDAMRAEAIQRMGGESESGPSAESFREGAEKRVRLGLLLSAAIRENSIELDRDKILAKVDELCEPYENPEQIRNIYMQNQQFLSQIQNMVMEEQVVNVLIGMAQTKQKQMGFRELMELSA